MPDTPTILTEGTSSANSDNIATASVEPSDDCLLVVNTSMIDSSALTISSVSTTLSNVGSWTIVQPSAQLGGSPERYNLCGGAYAQVTGDPGTGTVTVTFSASTRHKLIELAEVIGHDTTTPVAQSASNAGTAATLAVTLSSTPETDSLTMGGVQNHDQATGLSPATNYTELEETIVSGSTNSVLEFCYDEASATDTATWTTGNDTSAGWLIEISNASGGEPGRTTKNTDTHALGLGTGISQRIKTTVAF